MTAKRVAAPLMILALAGGVAAPIATAKTVSIGVDDDFFAPKTKTVKKGTTLKFVWRGASTHNVIASGAATAKSKYQTTGTFSFKARKKGTIKLLCDLHSGMTGTVKVK